MATRANNRKQLLKNISSNFDETALDPLHKSLIPLCGKRCYSAAENLNIEKTFKRTSTLKLHGKFYKTPEKWFSGDPLTKSYNIRLLYKMAARPKNRSPLTLLHSFQGHLYSVWKYISFWLGHCESGERCSVSYVEFYPFMLLFQILLQKLL